MSQRAIYANAVSFLIIAAILSWYFGGIGIIYAAGYFILYGLGVGIAAIIDPKTFSKDPPADR
jgi:hypothetical protein